MVVSGEPNQGEEEKYFESSKTIERIWCFILREDRIKGATGAIAPGCTKVGPPPY